MRHDATSFHRAYRDEARVLVPRDRISARVAELADAIAACYRGREVTILAVLTGAVIFLADLMRQLPLAMRIELVSVSSYPGTATASQGVNFRTQLPDLTGKDVLIVDDILDTGRTIAALIRAVRDAGADSVRTCVLLRKLFAKGSAEASGGDGRGAPDFVGFDIDDEFVVGYGLDFDNLYRNLPDLCVLDRHRRAVNGEDRP